MSGCCICSGRLRPCELFAPEPFFECERCGFVFRPDLDARTLRSVYAEGDYEQMRGEQYLEALADRRRDARVRLAYMRPWSSGGRLLDIGAAGGAFVAEAAAAGFDAHGLEPVPAFARAAREQLGVDVAEGSIEERDIGADAYDAITLWHVLEHLPDPLHELKRIAGALRAGGVVAIEVPNAGSAVARHMGSAWPSLEPSVHVNQFTPESLHLALERAGFAVRDLRTSAITPYLRRGARLGAGHLAGRAKAALWLRDPRAEHPSGHELLRAVGSAP